ncbi:MAG: hypothetical protein EAX96_16260 [Candidatus Lokiarchaeota archaeon]|nr:hypothetical protein [Candidatus Lokiarchaeota archaeon]
MVVDDWKNYRQVILDNVSNEEEDVNKKVKELFERIDNLVFENTISKNNEQLLSTKIQLLETRVKLLEDQNPERLAIINKILFDILDELVFLQIADDVLKLEDGNCPKCNQPLTDELYQKIKIDIDSLLKSVKKIETDIAQEIQKMS